MVFGDNVIFHQTPTGEDFQPIVFQAGEGTDQVTWTPTSNSGVALGRAGSGIIGDFLYAFGSGIGPYAQAINWNTDHWQLSTPPEFGECNYCGVSTGNNIYLIGWYSDYTVGAEVQKFTPTFGAQGDWDLMADYPFPACGIAGAYDGGNFIYTSGGADMVDVFTNAYKYDIQNDEWLPIAPLPVPMMYHGGVFIDGNYHVVGGVTEGGVVHYAYDPATDTWSAKSPLLIPNHFALFNLSSNADYIFSIGGGGGYYIWQATDALQVYNPDTDEWTLDTPLLEAYGMNTARIVPDGDAISCGGLLVNYVQETFRGTGFPGSVTNVDVPLESSHSPTGFNLSPVYPNPFNSQANISFQLFEDNYVYLELFNINSGSVATLVDEKMSAGSKIVNFYAKDLPNGIYFIKLKVGKSFETQKIIYLK